MGVKNEREGDSIFRMQASPLSRQRNAWHGEMALPALTARRATSPHANNLATSQIQGLFPACY
jgi:hypothetical protein